jgi:hypothetical protein
LLANKGLRGSPPLRPGDDIPIESVKKGRVMTRVEKEVIRAMTRIERDVPDEKEDGIRAMI